MNNLWNYLLQSMLGITSLWITLLHLLVVGIFAIQLLLVRRPVAVAFAWLFIVATLPLFGILLFFMIGERPVGRALRKKITRMEEHYAQITQTMRTRYAGDKQFLPQEAKALSLLIEANNGTPAVAGNRVTLHTNSLSILQGMIVDIESAKKSLHLEFYIWAVGGQADSVCEALIAACKRGVACRILLDSLGSKEWFKSDWPARFKAAGIELTEALPIQLGRFQFRRADLRLHRKIFVVDGAAVWTGSMNLVDPRTFKQSAGVGEWVDAMVRVEGPIASQFELTFLFDWSVDNTAITQFSDPEPLGSPEEGHVLAQCCASGPVYRDDILYQMLLSTIMDAREELTITTPYFGPDEGLIQALIAAARRGVNVTLIVPKHNDSTLVALSSRSFYGDLMNGGVNIAEFHGGLLHTKSMLVDRRIAVFGSVNLDQRSLRLNFEISLIVYNETFCANLQKLIESYLQQSNLVNPVSWAKRSRWHLILENVVQLMSPLL